MRVALVLVSFLLPAVACAQWEMQDAHVTADLRGIEYVGNGVAWASGSHGTVLRTEDMGFVWQLCATPPEAKDLDFRGVQAFDNNTAIVMSSGPGDKSRLYKTTDGCQTWTLLLTDPDKSGFFDAVQFENRDHGVVLGDPVDGYFVLLATFDGGRRWVRSETRTLKAESPQAGAFAASNSSLRTGSPPSFVSGGPPAAFFYEGDVLCDAGVTATSAVECFRTGTTYQPSKLPMNAANTSSGAFATAGGPRHATSVQIVVGGNYRKPDENVGTAAYIDYRAGGGFKPAVSPPHGYRSAVSYDDEAKCWITVGPNGTDISMDDGRNWRALKPGPGDAVDADRNWNALSLPFVVGPKGRIGILQSRALKEASPQHAK